MNIPRYPLIILLILLLLPMPATAVPHAQGGDGTWDDRFTLPGMEWDTLTDFAFVNGLMAAGNDVYAVGRFTTGSQHDAAYVGRWDGRRWYSLGGGLDERAFGVAVQDNRVYVGGMFQKASNVTANGIAMWDGATWSALGTGVDVADSDNPEWVNALVLDGDDLYIGGLFSAVDGVPAQNIAKWNGTRWSAVDGGTDGEVETLLLHDGKLYVGGGFTQAGNQHASSIAVWDGATWSTLGQGMESNFDGTTVYAIVADGVDANASIYASGYFQRAGGQVANSIARWDGTQWHSLNNGALVDDEILARVYSLIISNNKLYAGGNFNSVGDVGAHHIATWDGNAWSLIGGTDGPVYALAARSDGGVYLGGDFDASGGVFSFNIAQYGDPGWRAFGQGVANETIVGTVHAMARDSQNRLFVGGFIRRVGGMPVSHIAMWDGDVWHALGAGVNDRVRAIAIDGDKVYVGGNFSQADGMGVNNIAIWNTTTSTWSPLGSGTDDTVFTLLHHNGSLYAGGDFLSAGTVSTSYVARWDGTSWHSLGQQDYDFFCRSSIGSPRHGIFALAAIGDNIFMGGEFVRMSFGKTCINDVHSIVVWNAATDEWFTMENGIMSTAGSSAVAGEVYALTAIGNTLYVGGEFEKAGSVVAKNLARWTPAASWSPIGTGITGPTDPVDDNAVRALLANGSDLYIGGIFTAAGPTRAFHIARLDTNTDVFHALGDGLTIDSFFTDDGVTALAAVGTSLYAGGDFIKAGGLWSSAFGRWGPMPVNGQTPLEPPDPQGDDDGDGIRNAAEDVNGNGDPTDDDTDGDLRPNYLDSDDDNDGIPTKDEGTSDQDGDGVPDYLDVVDDRTARKLYLPAIRR